MNFKLISTLRCLVDEYEFVENHSEYGLIIDDLGEFVSSIIKNSDWFINEEGYPFFDNIKKLKIEPYDENKFIIY